MTDIITTSKLNRLMVPTEYFQVTKFRESWPYPGVMSTEGELGSLYGLDPDIDDEDATSSQNEDADQLNSFSVINEANGDGGRFGDALSERASRSRGSDDYDQDLDAELPPPPSFNMELWNSEDMGDGLSERMASRFSDTIIEFNSSDSSSSESEQLFEIDEKSEMHEKFEKIKSKDKEQLKKLNLRKENKQVKRTEEKEEDLYKGYIDIMLFRDVKYSSLIEKI